MLDKAVEKIFERATEYKTFSKCEDKQTRYGHQMLVSKEDVPLIVEAYNNKKISIREYRVGAGKQAYNDGWFIQRNVTYPVELKGDRVYLGEDLWVDADKLFINTDIGWDKTTPGQEKRVCCIELTAWQTYGDFNGKDVTPENSKHYMFNRVICEVKKLEEFAGNRYENYFVAADGWVFTNKGHGKDHLTPLVMVSGKAASTGKGVPYYHVVLQDVTRKPHPLNVHRLVATLFVPNDDPIRKTDVNHRDLHPENNAADNLEWCTKAYNAQYSYTFRALEKALPGIDYHEWLDDCRNLTEKVLNLKSEEKTALTAAAAVQISERINNKHLASAS